MIKWYWLAGVVVFFSSIYSICYAGNQAGDATLTLGDGYYWFSSKRHIDNTGIPYGAIAYNLTDHWGIEGMVGFFTTDSRRTIDNGKEVSGTLYAIDAIYRFSPYCRFEPYVLAGPGAISMSPNGNDANTEGTVNGGVGAQYFFSEKIALRVDARDFYTIVGGKNDFFLDGGVSFLF
jgi:OOP family OmpA-OmpF porin